MIKSWDDEDVPAIRELMKDLQLAQARLRSAHDDLATAIVSAKASLTAIKVAIYQIDGILLEWQRDKKD
jgi:DNA-binding protein YbaB